MDAIPILYKAALNRSQSGRVALLEKAHRHQLPRCPLVFLKKIKRILPQNQYLHNYIEIYYRLQNLVLL